MNRRQFFKTIAATVAGVVAVGVGPKVVRDSDREVVWGTSSFEHNSLFSMIYLKGHNPHSIFVKTIEPVKKGQALVWNPDGTVRGV